MALKFLNKKGWHTGSLRNIENVWKAEQKHDAEQKKLEELRKQIQEEREKSEFRLLQEQAGLVPKQERLDFLYDSGLATRKGTSDGFKALESYPKAETSEAAPAQASKEKSSAPGALFEDKPQSANDAWRKLHSDPLLLIRQREQEALARIKNNPIQMANIRKSVEGKKKGEKKKSGKKKEHGKHSRKKSKHEQDDASEGDDRKKSSHRESRKRVEQYSSSGESDSETEESRKRSYDKYSLARGRDSEKDVGKGEERNRSRYQGDKRDEMYSPNDRDDSENEEKKKRSYDKYSSSKDQGMEKDVANQGDEIRNRSHHHDVKRRDRHSPYGRSDLETEVRKRSYDKHSSYRDRRSEKDAASHEEEKRYRSCHHYDRRSGMHSSEGRSISETEEKKTYDKYASSKGQRSERGAGNKDEEREKTSRGRDDVKLQKNSFNGGSDSETEENRERNHEKSKHERHSTQIMEAPKENLERAHHKQRRPVTKLSEEEKAARLREMQMDAVLHEEQRWKRLKKASENDEALEASEANASRGQNFLNAAQKSVYGAEKGGSSTIEESVRRRKYFSQGRSESNEGNAFRR